MAAVQTPGLDLPPVAPFLMQALRAVGYSLSSALADLVDNSIAASSTKIDIRFTHTPEPLVWVLDNGEGMNEASLVSAMRFGSRDPRAPGPQCDLGRFGLGLKTASLSQCRRFTVVSLQGGTLSVAAWDLKECEQRGLWWLSRPPLEEIPEAPIADLRSQGRGTCVVWQDLDRLLGPSYSNPAQAMDSSFVEAADHLALVFHRFLSGEIVGPFEIAVNKRPLPRLDPFLDGHSRGQSLHPEEFEIDGNAVKVSPFVLPFPSRLRQEELAVAGGREAIKTGHGFYIYRGGRLVVPGGWFRIVPSDELVRLARVRVDVPVSLDHIWKIDIRKATVEPPSALRPHLRRLVKGAAARSRRVYTHRGQVAESWDGIPLWNREDVRDEGSRWRVNRTHPFVMAMTGGPGMAPNVERLLSVLEDALPVHAIHLHMSNDLAVADPEAWDESSLTSLARTILAALEGNPETAARFLERLPVTEPFSREPERARIIAEGLRS